MAQGTIVDINPRRGMFLVAIHGGEHAVFTLYDHVILQVGDVVAGALEELGSERLTHCGHQRQLFEAFGESGPCSLAACRQLMQAAP